MLPVTVRDFVDSLSHRPELPIVASGTSLKEVVCAMVKGRRRRIVYVVDSKDRLIGSITLNDLKDVVFRYYLNGRVPDVLVFTEHIERLFASERAEDLMARNLPVCHEFEGLRDVIARMIQQDVQDIPVLDKEGRVVADLDILDLLELWVKSGGEVF